MGWARLDDRWHDHPKVIAAGLEAVGLWSMCLTWAHHNRRKAQRPGFVPKEVVTRFAAGKAARLARKLTDVGLFDPADGGWMIHDFTRYLPKYDSAKAAEAGRRGAAARWEDPPDEPPPDDEPPWGLDSGLPSSRLANGSRNDGKRTDAPASTRRNPVPKPSSGYLGSSVTRVDARETPSLLPLCEALDAVRLHVRWDRLPPPAVERIGWLVDVHGVPALVAAAQRAWQPNDPPAYANAWLAAWDSLPLPKPHLVAVLCGVHRLDQPCRGCAADAKAGTA